MNSRREYCPSEEICRYCQYVLEKGQGKSEINVITRTDGSDKWGCFAIDLFNKDNNTQMKCSYLRLINSLIPK